jgi:hypothetical protein
MGTAKNITGRLIATYICQDREVGDAFKNCHPDAWKINKSINLKHIYSIIASRTVSTNAK